MDLSAIMSTADPRSLADGIQSSVDYVAGKHIDLASLQLLADTVSGIDITFIIINLIIILIIIFITTFAARVVDRMLLNYIPKVTGRVEVKTDETVQLMIRRLVSAAIYIIGMTNFKKKLFIQ